MVLCRRVESKLKTENYEFLKTRQIMEEQEHQFASENKALWSTSPLHVAQ